MKYITEDMNIENEHISKYLLYVLVYDDNILGDAILPFTMDIPNLTMEMLNKDNGRILKLIIPKINTMVKNKILDIRMVPKFKIFRTFRTFRTFRIFKKIKIKNMQ